MPLTLQTNRRVISLLGQLHAQKSATDVICFSLKIIQLKYMQKKDTTSYQCLIIMFPFITKHI